MFFLARRPQSQVVSVGTLLVALLALPGCHSPGPFVWIDKLAPEQTVAVETAYVVAANDVVMVQVFNHPEMSGRTRVRSDGNLSIGLLGDVQAAGKAPANLATEIAEQLTARSLAVGARVTVTLDEAAPVRVAMIGEVARPGLYALSAGAGLAEALASCGGFTDFAHRDRVYVMRQTPTLTRIRFTYADVLRGTRGTATFRLRSGDTIVAE
ncbi:MAG: polysaccharide biosynthesis/export family protein [Gemmatimonadota bacterium]